MSRLRPPLAKQLRAGIQVLDSGSFVVPYLIAAVVEKCSSLCHDRGCQPMVGSPVKMHVDYRLSLVQSLLAREDPRSTSVCLALCRHRRGQVGFRSRLW
jgi:hypothetical protein